MFHILTITYQQPADVIAEMRPAHMEWLQAEIEAGRLILTGRLESQQGGVLITGDISTEAAEELMAADPYSQAGLVHYERVGFTGGGRARGL
ncbi:YciI family protein [Mycolicibacterium komossense]|uniref:GTP cyclohydrolase n=1 Tax=Mycolicibacterium komossense TaxID=1779 RepID=A0ABT3CH32_9MYCO|nr:YciI family protein [Mycolicibacterium komossense]MCV7228541.1 GTP cyclohydrolase [Mycolicibacterium komossense]